MKLKMSFPKFVITLAALFCFIFTMNLAGMAQPAPVSTNAITLSVSPNPAKVKQKITLTAGVTTNGSAATGGTVVFYDGKLQLASAQVVGKSPAKGYKTGNAILTTILAPGSHSLTALYEGIASAPQVVTSSPVALTVSGKTRSLTLLTAKADSQNPQNYDFMAVAGGFGFSKPTGTVDFSDSTSGADLGSVTLDAASAFPGFGPALLTNPQGMPAQTVVADFNGDGFPDVASTNASFTASQMAVLLGKANGQFQTPTFYQAGYFCSGIVAGDFNNDGIIDLVAMNQDGTIQLFPGNGDGTFQNSITNNVGGTPVAIAMGDFNRDGILDYVTVDYFANSASISLGNGDGTFQPAVPYQIGSGPYSVATADFNNDGYLDLAAVNDNVNSVSVLLGNGDGTFQSQKVYETGNQVEFVTTGDLNGDGKQDMIVANYADKSVGVFLGNGDGTFKAQVTYTVGGPDSGLAIADLNGDGIPDIAASYYHPSQVGVLIGKGDGTFGAVHEFNTAQQQGYEVTIADLNGDGTPDIINCDLNSSLSVLLNGTGNTAFLTNVTVPGTGAHKIVAAYSGNSKYAASQSKPVTVQGSGAK